jgi:Helicase conserved C-terminal domain
VNWRLSKAVNLAGADRIPRDDARRQSRTAAEILRRFDIRPGVILADEVGMGKTYVALAVAASVIDATRGGQPVVVMVPASVQDKWPREWEVFREKCLGDRLQIRGSQRSIRNGADFLKLLDDPARTRRQLIFLTHGALTSSLADPYIKLAIVRRALRRGSLAAQRKAFPRWAGRVLGWHEFFNIPFVRALIEANPRAWRSVYRRETGRYLEDDPVPTALLTALRGVDLAPLVEALRRTPLRESSQLDTRLAAVRGEIADILPSVWKQCLTKLDVELPLLILDEAHHLKNPWTRLAGLFESPKAEADVQLLQGPLASVFDRMLFLTATPFQLGHQELIQVLRRFSAVRWSTPVGRDEYEGTVDELEGALDAAQRSALRLDTVWGRLRPEDLNGFETTDWWQGSGDGPERLRQAAMHFREARMQLKAAERLLKPWVIRHARPDKATRRKILTGRAIVTENAAERGGLRVGGEAVLPFLLAARMQSLAAAKAHESNRHARAYFAEGLASSFEAYRETRLDKDAREDLAKADQTAWYERQIRRALPPGKSVVAGAHPKIEATANRATQLWREGEKVLIFCFYIATGRALRTHIARAVRQEIIRLGAARLGLEGRSPESVAERLRRRADRFFDPRAPVTRVARDTLNTILEPSLKSGRDLDRCVEISLRFLRTPLFLVRYVDLGAEDRAAAFQRALTMTDGSGRSLHDRIERFGEFVADRIDIERDELLRALEEIPTGSELLIQASERARDLFPNVRLANGDVDRHTRRRLMLSFNTPFFPDVLIASAVMAEGVDLQIDCRHVIHHDLDWNPSVLEQRTGRVDRLGSKSELSGHPILVYEPFLEATQDEKQFRVVKDRERWFNVIMGERLELDEWTTDRLAERVELPEAAAQELAFRLEVLRERGGRS